MNKALIIVVLVLAIKPLIIAQEGSLDSIALIGYWSIGDKNLYEVTTKKQSYKDGTLDENIERKVIVSLEVIDSTADHYKIRYTNESLWPDTNNAIVRKAFEQDFLNTLSYEFLTDPYGEFKELSNWEELRNGISNTLELHISSSEKNDSTLDEAGISFLKEVIENKDFIEIWVYKEIGYVFSDYGYLYSIKDTIKYKESLSGILGLGQMPADGEFFIDHNPKQEELIYTTKIKVDPKIAKETIISTLEELDKKYGIESARKGDIREELKSMDFEMESITSKRFNSRTGWIKEGNYREEVEIKNNQEHLRKIEERFIKMIN